MNKITKKNFDKIKEISIHEIEKYVDKLNELYHKKGKSPIDDELYDMIVEYLNNCKSHSSVLKNIGEKRGKEFKKLPIYLGSEDKTYEHDNKLSKWLKNNNISEEDDVVLSAKADGICILIYNSNIYTRGDGNYGRLKNEIKDFLNFEVTKEIKVRGELIIKKSDLDEINKKYNFKNVRNLVCGQINRKTIDEDIGKNLFFLGYDVIDDNITQLEKFDILKNVYKIGTVKYVVVKAKHLNYDYLKKILSDWKYNLDYYIDGIVIRDNKVHNISSSNKYSWSISFKHNFNTYKANVDHISWQISKSGRLIPVAILYPHVEIDNTIVKRVTCNNAKYVIDNKIGNGSIIKITKSGDIIPNIKSIIKEGDLKLPEYDYYSKGVHIYIKDSDDTINVKKILYFLKYFKYEDIGMKTLEKINSEHKLTDVFSFLRLKEKDLSFLGKKTSLNIYNIIDDLKDKKLFIVDLLSAISIFDNISRRRLFEIYKNFPDIHTYNKHTIYDKLISLKGFKEKITNEFIVGIGKFINDRDKYNKNFNIYYKISDNDNIVLYVSLSGFRDMTYIQDKIKNYNIIITTVNKSDVLIIKERTPKKSSKIIEAEKKINVFLQ